MFQDYIRDNKNVTEEPADIGETIRNIFVDCQERTDSPVVLLVHDEERTCNFLKNMQVNTSTWRFGIKDLVNPGCVHPLSLCLKLKIFTDPIWTGI